ncbi:hypothetical protein NQ314_000153 [Rhamnusium bicolor]|uniref:Pentatricopeptide repeat-containing protein n=1 Tax=Rhamnusium bicolor TaxID=1586634 RepID=A0AAV8ZWZ5_9CUCU|nr:hypothetical protein NQ314_000153 [Rhamnusium bicolor]
MDYVRLDGHRDNAKIILERMETKNVNIQNLPYGYTCLMGSSENMIRIREVTDQSSAEVSIKNSNMKIHCVFAAYILLCIINALLYII